MEPLIVFWVFFFFLNFCLIYLAHFQKSSEEQIAELQKLHEKELARKEQELTKKLENREREFQEQMKVALVSTCFVLAPSKPHSIIRLGLGPLLPGLTWHSAERL